MHVWQHYMHVQTHCLAVLSDACDTDQHAVAGCRPHMAGKVFFGVMYNQQMDYEGLA